MTVTQMAQSQQQQRIGEISQRTRGRPHVNPYGTPGMSLNDAGDYRKIVSVDEGVARQVRQIAFNHMKNGYGVSDGEDISAVIRNYTMTLSPDKRLSASWTLNELFHSEAARLGEFVHQHDPSWDWGKPFDTSILDGCRQDSGRARFDTVSISGEALTKRKDIQRLSYTDGVDTLSLDARGESVEEKEWLKGDPNGDGASAVLDITAPASVERKKQSDAMGRAMDSWNATVDRLKQISESSQAYGYAETMKLFQNGYADWKAALQKSDPEAYGAWLRMLNEDK